MFRWKLWIEFATLIYICIYFHITKYVGFPRLPPSLGARAMRLFIRLVTFSVFALSLIQFLLLTYIPCTPPFILSMLPNCSSSKFGKLSLVRVSIHVVESWMGWHIIFSASFSLLGIFYVGIVCLLHYMRVLERYSFLVIISYINC